jgi:hypothetical protein
MSREERAEQIQLGVELIVWRIRGASLLPTVRNIVHTVPCASLVCIFDDKFGGLILHKAWKESMRHLAKTRSHPKMAAVQRCQARP